MMNEEAYYIVRAKEWLGSHTPMRFDCGTLCARACCRGEGVGMELLPGEWEASDLRAYGARTGHIFVCEGRCSRKTRPYACMIFPLFPLVRQTADGGISVVAVNDVRARRVCPIAGERLLPDFYRHVRRSAYMLCEQAALRDYLLEKTREYMEIEAFYRRMTDV